MPDPDERADRARPAARPTAEPTEPADPFRWLEDVAGDDAMDWVRARSAEAVGRIGAGSRFGELRDGAREVLDSTDRIAYVTRGGQHLYNFWQDAEHLRGLWRRTTLESYRSAEPAWDVLIDVDELGRAEDVSWVWHGAQLLRPTYDRALVTLSPGGSDAEAVREFDLATRAFVPGGFELPVAKSEIGWIDRDGVFVGTDTGPGSLTTSGYPRQIREWRRGADLADAPVVFEGTAEDMIAYGYHDPTPGFERDVFGRKPDFFTSEEFVRVDGELLRIEVPDDAETDLHREWLLLRLRTDAELGGARFPAGALLAARLDDVLAGTARWTAIYTPDERSSLQGWSCTRHHLVLDAMVDVVGHLRVLTPPASGDDWTERAWPDPSEFAVVSVVGTDPDATDEIFLQSSGFLLPPTLSRVDLSDPDGTGGGVAEVLRSAPAFFPTGGLSVRQFRATSDDGTSVPYFVVGADEPDRPRPTLLYGYGGFEIALTPWYGGLTGRGWIARGGTFVVANIRGGGEYGPPWHAAALREKRPRAFEDFAAVAADLVERGITTPDRLAAQGGSNGGLLMGVMLTRYPERFGAIVCQVPLLDMRRFHLLLAGASWAAEYGDPDDPSDWAYLQAFSPYHNVGAGPYPPVLFTTSTRDDRVHPGHARKMAAAMLGQGADVTYWENVEGGHGAGADNEQVAFLHALELEFCWRTVGGTTS